MQRTEIVEKLNGILFTVTGGEGKKIESEDQNLVTDLGLNSIGILYTVIGIEETFGIRFENVGVGDFKTVSDVVDYIEGQIS